MLTNWLNPIESSKGSNYFNQEFSCQGNFPDLKDSKIVVFSREAKFSQEVRKALGALFNHFEASIVDIGNLNSSNPSSNYQVISELQDGYILPILLGTDLDAFRKFCNAMKKEERLNNCAFISNKISPPSEEFNIENIGYQRHCIAKHQYQEVADSNTPGLSLGMLRSNQRILEPILRESNYLHFDLAAVRLSEVPGKKNSLPTGLYTEEACQIMRYAGEGMRLKLVSIDTDGLDNNNKTEAMLVAEMIWYLHEGIEVRGNDHPALSKNFKEYIIELNEVDHSLTFAQSTKTGKWWMKIDNASNNYVSCAYEEYQQTIQNEIPERLLKLL